VHELRVVDASDVAAVMTALRAAINGGPALLPKDFRAVRGGSSQESALLTEVPASVSVVIETSGSTGTPKRVALSEAALTASGHAAHDRLGGPGQWLLALPLTYIAGISVLVRSLLAETEPVVLPSGHFDPSYFIEHVLQMTDARRYTSLVPVQLARLVEYAEEEESARGVMGRLDAILLGGQALDPALAARAQQLGWNVVATYGSSETAGGCVYDGIALDGVGARIGNPATREVWLSGVTLAEGYLRDDALTAEHFVVDSDVRWYRTGDAGDLTDGVLTITGRLDRVLISGGLKISLDAVEAAARAVSGGESTVAVSVPDSEWGQRPALVLAGITASPERDALDDGLYEAIVAAMGRAAAPRVIHHVATMPRLTNGKVDLVAITQILREADA
jgi:O-succinylbenzoic acid--CoA ligase